METEVDFIKYGFTEDSEYKGLWTRRNFPISISVKDGCLDLFVEGVEYCISSGEIPATNQSVVLLLKAFNKPKL